MDSDCALLLADIYELLTLIVVILVLAVVWFIFKQGAKFFDMFFR